MRSHSIFIEWEIFNLLLHLGKYHLNLTRPQLMGIVNVTPESRYGGGQTRLNDQILRRVEQMVQHKVDIIDIGGESTRPGASPVSLQEELERVIPVIETIHANFPVPMSIDTQKTAVMQAALLAGAAMINDVNALQNPGALELVAANKVAVCLMHRQGLPQTMQENPHYANVVTEVKNFLEHRIEACLNMGIARDRIVIDPGFGFGKTLTHNLILLRNLDKLQQLGFPVLVGLSRKIMIEAVLGLPVEERLSASITLAVLAISKGALIIRTHDVKETGEAIRMATAVLEEI